jgi:hypothetical protein
LVEKLSHAHMQEAYLPVVRAPSGWHPAKLVPTRGAPHPNKTANQYTNHKFREDLIELLWLYAGNTGLTAFLAASHEWVKLVTIYKKCIQCKAHEGTQGLKMKAKRRPLEELNTNSGKALPSPRTSWGCKQCEVALCIYGGCWEAFHRIE